jgi:uncharacterized protein YbaA (DUF1428 family)
MPYVDGFVIPVSRRQLATYRRIARLAGKVWMENGALEYRECVGDDLKQPFGIPFPRLARLKAGEVVLFSFIVYKSRAARDRINKRVMKDPRILKLMEPGKMPFDDKRMTYGGFKTIVSL